LQGQVIGNAGKPATQVVSKPVTSPVVTTAPVSTGVKPVTATRQNVPATTTNVNPATRILGNNTTVAKPNGSANPVVQRNSTTVVQRPVVRRTNNQNGNSNTNSNNSNNLGTVRR
jgi:hypothetical protein